MQQVFSFPLLPQIAGLGGDSKNPIQTTLAQEKNDEGKKTAKLLPCTDCCLQ